MCVCASSMLGPSGQEAASLHAFRSSREILGYWQPEHESIPVRLIQPVPWSHCYARKCGERDRAATSLEAPTGLRACVS